MTTPVHDRPTLKVLRITRRTVRPGTADSSVLGTEHEEQGSDDSHMSNYPYSGLFYRGPSAPPTPESKGGLQPHARGDSTPKNNPRALARGRSALARPPVTVSTKADDDYLTSFLDDIDMDYSSAVDIFSESLTESDSTPDAEYDGGEGLQSLLYEFQELDRPALSADQCRFIKVSSRPALQPLHNFLVLPFVWCWHVMEFVHITSSYRVTSAS